MASRSSPYIAAVQMSSGFSQTVSSTCREVLSALLYRRGTTGSGMNLENKAMNRSHIQRLIMHLMSMVLGTLH